MEKESEEKDQKRDIVCVSSDNLPLAVSCIMDDVAEIRAKVDYIYNQLGLGVTSLKPVTMKEAAQFLSLSVGSVGRMVREKTIPHYKRNGKVYFFEKELFEWVKSGRVLSLEEESILYFRQRRR